MSAYVKARGRKFPAVILADNYANPHNFRPLSIDTPVALLPVVNTPIIDYCIESLVSSGCNNIIILASSHASDIQEYIAKSVWSRRTATLDIAVRVCPHAKTAGDAMRFLVDPDILKLLKSTSFVLTFANVVSNIDMGSVFAKHRANVANYPNTAATIIFNRMSPTHAARQPSHAPIIGVNPFTSQLLYYDNNVQSATTNIPLDIIKSPNNTNDFHVGPRGRIDMFSNILETGMMICTTHFLNYFRDEIDAKQVPYDYISHVLSLTPNDDEPSTSPLEKGIICVHVEPEAYSVHVTDMRTYHTCSHDIIRGWAAPFSLSNNTFGTSFRHFPNNVFRERDIQLQYTTVLRSDVVIGARSRLGEYTTLHKAIIGQDVNIGAKSSITSSYILPNTWIGSGCVINGTFIGSNVTIGNNVVIHKGAIIGNNVVIDSNVIIPPFTSITACNEYTSEEQSALRLELRRISHLRQLNKYVNIAELQTQQQLLQQTQLSSSSSTTTTTIQPIASSSSSSFLLPLPTTTTTTTATTTADAMLSPPPQPSLQHSDQSSVALSIPSLQTTPSLQRSVSCTVAPPTSKHNLGLYTLDQFPIDPCTFFYNHETEPELLTRRVNLQYLASKQLVEFSLASFSEAINTFGPLSHMIQAVMSSTNNTLAKCQAFVQQEICAVPGSSPSVSITSTTSKQLRADLSPAYPSLASSEVMSSSATMATMPPSSSSSSAAHFAMENTTPYLSTLSSDAFPHTTPSALDDHASQEDLDDLALAEALSAPRLLPRILLPDLYALQCDVCPHPIYRQQGISMLLQSYQQEQDAATTTGFDFAQNQSSTVATTTPQSHFINNNNNNNTIVSAHNNNDFSCLSTGSGPAVSSRLTATNASSLASPVTTQSTLASRFMSQRDTFHFTNFPNSLKTGLYLRGGAAAGALAASPSSATPQSANTNNHNTNTNNNFPLRSSPFGFDRSLALANPAAAAAVSSSGPDSQLVAQHQSDLMSQQFPYYPFADLNVLRVIPSDLVVGLNGYGRIYLTPPHPTFGRAARMSNSITPPFYLSLRNYAPYSRSHVMMAVIDDLDLTDAGYGLLDPRFATVDNDRDGDENDSNAASDDDDNGNGDNTDDDNDALYDEDDSDYESHGFPSTSDAMSPSRLENGGLPAYLVIDDNIRSTVQSNLASVHGLFKEIDVCIEKQNHSVPDRLQELGTIRMSYAIASHDVFLTGVLLSLFHSAGFNAPSQGVWCTDFFTAQKTPFEMPSLWVNPPSCDTKAATVKLTKSLTQWSAAFGSHYSSKDAREILLPAIIAACSMNPQYNSLLVTILSHFWNDDLIATDDIDSYLKTVHAEAITGDNHHATTLGTQVKSSLPALLDVEMFVPDANPNHEPIRLTHFQFAAMVYHHFHKNCPLPSDTPGIQFHGIEKLFKNCVKILTFLREQEDDDDEDEDEDDE